nr:MULTISPECIES: cytochrome P450 [unclassified Streptomyces]
MISGPSDEPVDLSSVDLVGPEAFRSGDQHRVWRHLRTHAPVWWHQPRQGGTGFWCVTRYADCERVLKDHQTFSSEAGSIIASVDHPDPAGGRTISLMDPPRHTGLRTRSMKTFSHTVVRAKSGTIRGRIRDLVDSLPDSSEADFARAVALLPMIASGELLGLPSEMWADISLWINTSLAPEDPAYATGATVAETLAMAHHELFDRFTDVIRARRRRPGTDLVSLLIDWRDGDRPADDTTIALNCYSFVLGAHSTTPHVAAHTLMALMDRPRIWDRAAVDPSLVPAVVEEGVRWSSPTHHLARKVVSDTRIGDTPVAAGSWVVAWVASANRDETVFTQPYVFDVDRAPNHHIGFGGGPHYCIGAPLARMALVMLFEELTSRLDRVEPAGDPVHLLSNWINGIVSLPITAKRR